MICENVHSVNIGDMAKGSGYCSKLYNAVTGLYERVGMQRTPCHLGGYRQWFTCPKCGERCGVLYARNIYACRKCHGLRYVAELETLQDRAIRKAIKFRKRFGYQGGGIVSPFPAKPKLMRWHTYLGARERDKELCEIAFKFTAIKIGIL